MTFNIVIQARARAEVIEAYSWYEEQISGLGENFLNEFEACLKFIQKNPRVYSISRGKYREAPFGKFPFIFIYRIDQKNNKIVIVSVFHFKRNPRRKPR